MRMRLPESGSLVESLLSGLGNPVIHATNAEVEGVTEAQLAAALEAYRRGDPAWNRPFQWSPL